MFPSPKITNENVLQIVGISADAHNAENWEDEFDLDSAGNNALVGNQIKRNSPDHLSDDLDTKDEIDSSPQSDIKVGIIGMPNEYYSSLTKPLKTQKLADSVEWGGFMTPPPSNTNSISILSSFGPPKLSRSQTAANDKSVSKLERKRPSNISIEGGIVHNSSIKSGSALNSLSHTHSGAFTPLQTAPVIDSHSSFETAVDMLLKSSNMKHKKGISFDLRNNYSKRTSDVRFSELPLRDKHSDKLDENNISDNNLIDKTSPKLVISNDPSIDLSPKASKPILTHARSMNSSPKSVKKEVSFDASYDFHRSNSSKIETLQESVVSRLVSKFETLIDNTKSPERSLSRIHSIDGQESKKVVSDSYTSPASSVAVSENTSIQQIHIDHEDDIEDWDADLDVIETKPRLSISVSNAASTGKSDEDFEDWDKEFEIETSIPVIRSGAIQTGRVSTDSLQEMDVKIPTNFDEWKHLKKSASKAEINHYGLAHSQRVSNLEDIPVPAVNSNSIPNQVNITVYPKPSNLFSLTMEEGRISYKESQLESWLSNLFLKHIKMKDENNSKMGPISHDIASPFFLDETDAMLSLIVPNGTVSVLQNSLIYPELSFSISKGTTFTSQTSNSLLAAREMLKREKELENGTMYAKFSDNIPSLIIKQNDLVWSVHVHVFHYRSLCSWLRTCLQKIMQLDQYKTESSRKKASEFVIQTTNILTEHCERRFKAAVSICPHQSWTAAYDLYPQILEWKALALDPLLPSETSLLKLVGDNKNSKALDSYIVDIEGIEMVSDCLTQLGWIAAKLSKSNALSTSMFDHTIRNLHFCAPHLSERFELFKTQSSLLKDINANKNIRKLVLLFARQAPEQLLNSISKFRVYQTTKRHTKAEKISDVKVKRGKDSDTSKLESIVWPLEYQHSVNDIFSHDDKVSLAMQISSEIHKAVSIASTSFHEIPKSDSIIFDRESEYLPILGDLDSAAGSLCSLHLLLSHFSPLNVEPLLSPVWDIDSDEYSWIDNATRGDVPLNPSISAVEACNELRQVPLCNSFMLSVPSQNPPPITEELYWSNRSSFMFSYGSYCVTNPLYNISPSLSRNNKTNAAAFLELSLLVEKLTWLLCGSANLRISLLNCFHCLLPNYSFLRATSSFCLSQYYLVNVPDPKKAESLLFESIFILDHIQTPVRSSVALVSWIGLNCLTSYGDLLLTLKKYRYAIITLEGAILSARLGHHKEQALSLYKRIGDTTVENRDWTRALKYFLHQLWRAKCLKQMNEYVYLAQQTSKIYVNQNQPISAVKILQEALIFLDESRHPDSNDDKLATFMLPLNLHRGAELSISLKLCQLHMDNFCFDEAISLATSLLSEFYQETGSQTRLATISEISSDKRNIQTKIEVAPSWNMSKDKAKMIYLMLAKAFVLKRMYNRADEVLDKLEYDIDTNSVTISTVRGGYHRALPSQWIKTADENNKSGDDDAFSVGISISHESFSGDTLGSGSTGSGIGRFASSILSKSAEFLILRAKNCFHSLQLNLAIRYVDFAMQASSSSNISFHAKCHFLRGKILASKNRISLQSALSSRVPPLPLFRDTKSMFSSSCEEANRIYSSGSSISRAELVSFIPDPKPAIEAFTIAYQYFRKVDDNYKAAKVLTHIVELYLSCLFPIVGQYGYPLFRLKSWLKSNDFNVNEMKNISDQDLKFESAIDVPVLDDPLGSCVEKNAPGCSDEKYDCKNSSEINNLLKSVYSKWESLEFKSQYDHDKRKEMAFQGSYVCMLRLEQPACQSLQVATDILSIPLLLTCYLNMAELRYLQGLISASQTSWSEASQLLLNNFLHAIPCIEARRVLFARMSLGLLIKLGHLYQRLIRLLFCYHSSFIQQNILLLDLYLQYQTALSAFVNSPPPIFEKRTPSSIAESGAKHNQAAEVIAKFGGGARLRARSAMATDSTSDLSKIGKKRQDVIDNSVPKELISNSVPVLNEKRILGQRFSVTASTAFTDPSSDASSRGSLGEKLAVNYHQMEMLCKQYGQGKIGIAEAREKNLYLLRKIFKTVQQIRNFTFPSASLLRYSGDLSVESKYVDTLRKIFPYDCFSRKSNLEFNVDSGFSRFHIAPYSIVYSLCVGNCLYLYSPSMQHASFFVSPMVPFLPEYGSVSVPATVFTPLREKCLTPFVKCPTLVPFSLSSLFEFSAAPTSLTKSGSSRATTMELFGNSPGKKEDDYLLNSIPVMTWRWQYEFLQHFGSIALQLHTYISRSFNLFSLEVKESIESQNIENAGSDLIEIQIPTSIFSSAICKIETQILLYLSWYYNSKVLKGYQSMSLSIFSSPYFTALLSKLPNIFARCAKSNPLSISCVKEFFKSLDPQNVIRLLGALFSEESIVLASSFPNRINSAISTLFSLFYPFTPSHLVIPLIEPESLGILGINNGKLYANNSEYSNQPFVIGVTSETLNSISVPNSIVLVHLDYNNIRSKSNSYPSIPNTFKNSIYKILIKFLGQLFIEKPLAAEFDHDSIDDVESVQVKSDIKEFKHERESSKDFSFNFDPYLDAASVFTYSPPIMVGKSKNSEKDVADHLVALSLSMQSVMVEMFSKYLLCWTPPSLQNYKFSSEDSLDQQEAISRLGFDLTLYLDYTPEDQRIFMKRFFQTTTFYQFIERRLLSLYILGQHDTLFNTYHLPPNVFKGNLGTNFDFEKLCMRHLCTKSFELGILFKSSVVFYLDSYSSLSLSCHMLFARNFKFESHSMNNRLDYSRRWVVLNNKELSVFKSKKDPLPIFIYPLDPGSVRVHKLNPSEFRENEFAFEIHFSMNCSLEFQKVYQSLVEKRDASRGFFSFDFSTSHEKETNLQSLGNISARLLPAPLCFIADSSENRSKWIKSIRARVLHPFMKDGYQEATNAMKSCDEKAE